MMNYTQTTHQSTSVPLPSVPCRQTPKHPAFSYAVGPLDLAQVTSLHVQLSTGDECDLLVPVHLPSSLLTHPVFQEGYEWGYFGTDPEEEEWTFPKLLNEVYALLRELLDEPDVYPWTLGFVLGELASIAEHDKTLALTGLAHFCFLLPLFTQERPADWPRYEPYHPFFLHQGTVKAYRARVRVYKEQGKSFAKAQRLALTHQERSVSL